MPSCQQDNMINLVIQMLQQHLPDALTESGLLDWSLPSVEEGYADEQMSLPVQGANCIKVWFAGAEQLRAFQASQTIYDDRGGIGILYAYAVPKPAMGEVKRKLADSIVRTIRRTWPHYLGREGVFRINTDVDYRYSSQVGSGGSRQSLMSSPLMPGNNIETLCVMLTVDYRVTEDTVLW